MRDRVVIQDIRQAGPGSLRNLGMVAGPGNHRSFGLPGNHRSPGIHLGFGDEVGWGHKAEGSFLCSLPDILPNPGSRLNPDSLQSPDTRLFPGIHRNFEGEVGWDHRAEANSLCSPPDNHPNPGNRWSLGRPDWNCPGWNRPDIHAPGIPKCGVNHPAPCWWGTRRRCQRCREAWTGCSDSFPCIHSAKYRLEEELDLRLEASEPPRLSGERRKQLGLALLSPSEIRRKAVTSRRQAAAQRLRETRVSLMQLARPGPEPLPRLALPPVRPPAEPGQPKSLRDSNSLGKDASEHFPWPAPRLQDRDGPQLLPGLFSARPSSSPPQPSASRQGLLPQASPATQEPVRQLPLPEPVSAV